MLNHRVITALFVIALVTAGLRCGWGTQEFWLSAGITTFLYLSIEFAGAYFIGLNFHLRSLNYLDRSSNKIALTFDDGPREPETTRVLDTLKKHDVKATFFVIGKNIEGHEPILKRMVGEGHSIGSHSFSHHYWIDVWGKEKLKNDLLKSLLSVTEAAGKGTKLMRPPYGVTTPNFRRVLKELGLQSVGWDVRSYDTTTSDVKKITDRVLAKTKGGSIVLLHDRLSYMPELLDKLIPELKKKNLEFVTLEP